MNQPKTEDERKMRKSRQVRQQQFQVTYTIFVDVGVGYWSTTAGNFCDNSVRKQYSCMVHPTQDHLASIDNTVDTLEK